MTRDGIRSQPIGDLITRPIHDVAFEGRYRYSASTSRLRRPMRWGTFQGRAQERRLCQFDRIAVPRAATDRIGGAWRCCGAAVPLPAAALSMRGGDDLGRGPARRDHARFGEVRCPTPILFDAPAYLDRSARGAGDAEPMKTLTVELNGSEVVCEVEPRETLADFLREDHQLTATHLGCEHGACGACTVLVDGMRRARVCALPSCAMDIRCKLSKASQHDRIMEVLRRYFHEGHALQCGFCTPGMLMMARDILLRFARSGRTDGPPPAQRADLPLYRLCEHRQRSGRRRPGDSGASMTV